ncbi:class I SAM-dependent methyltransferase [Candidatus Woesearchaeota archaeon]|nr:MAG: class I SAM-dependent methyltransferase [Candidatus Woesearchaeota archaeon]
MKYYDQISDGYDELHREEQLRKLSVIKTNLSIDRSAVLLDVGCGTGFAQEIFDCEYVGFDPSFELLKKAKKAGGRVFQAIAEQIPLKDNSIDISICVSVLHHIKDLDKALNEIKRVTRKIIVFSLFKKSKCFGEIRNKVGSYFKVDKIINDDKDLILFAR